MRDLDQIVVGTSWGVGIALDPKGRNRNRWASIRNREERRARGGKALSPVGLERAVMALAVTHPEYVVMGPEHG